MNARFLTSQEERVIYGILAYAGTAYARPLDDRWPDIQMDIEIVGIEIRLMRSANRYVRSVCWHVTLIERGCGYVEFKNGCDNERFTRELAMIRLVTQDCEGAR